QPNRFTPMKIPPMTGFSLCRRSRAYTFSVILTVVVLCLFTVIPSGLTLSNVISSVRDVSASLIDAAPQSQTTTLYLHGTGSVDNPPTLFLNTTAATDTTAKYKDSTSISRTGGNPWKQVGTWPAVSSTTTGEITALSDLHVWLGLKNSDDQGTYFDLRVEAYKNGDLLTSGQSLCITGVTRNAANAKEVVFGFDPFSATSFNGSSDVLS